MGNKSLMLKFHAFGLKSKSIRVSELRSHHRNPDYNFNMDWANRTDRHIYILLVWCLSGIANLRLLTTQELIRRGHYFQQWSQLWRQSCFHDNSNKMKVSFFVYYTQIVLQWYTILCTWGLLLTIRVYSHVADLQHNFCDWKIHSITSK